MDPLQPTPHHWVHEQNRGCFVFLFKQRGAGKGDKNPLTPMNTGWLGKKENLFMDLE